MPPLTYISAFRRTDANGGSRGEAMPEREIIIVNGEKIMAEMFGHSNNFATLSLSLSQVLTYSSSHIIKKRGHPRVNLRLSLQKCKGGQLVFCPPLNVKTNIETQ